MEIRYIRDEEKESYKAYLDLLMDINGSTDKLAEVKYEGDQYLVAQGVEGVGIIQNDGHGLYPFCLNVDGSSIEILTTSSYIYTIIHSGIDEVIKKDPFGDKEVRVSYLPEVEGFQREVIEYSQYDARINSMLECAYNVTGRGGLVGSLMFTNYHYPDVIRFTYLKKFGSYDYEKKHYYNLGIDEDTVYYSPLIVIRDYPIGTKRKTFNADKLMSQFESHGFTREIPSQMQELVSDTNEVYKTLKLVNKEYKNFIKGQ